MNTDFSGVHSALVTPFDKLGHIDFTALGELIAMQKMAGLHGIVLAGSTGEAATLNLAERISLISHAKKYGASGMKIIAGAGSNCTKTAIELQAQMAEAGADATLQVCPYYNKPSDDGVYAHFAAIAKSTKLPMILYNVPSRTGLDMKAHIIARLALDFAHIIGIKEANPCTEKLINLMALIKAQRPDFHFLAGEDTSLLPFLALGAHGIISTSSQVAHLEMLALYQATKNGDLIYAQKIAQKINGFLQLMFSHSNPIPIKTLLAKLGLIQKYWRLPMCALDAEQEQIFLTKCQEFDFLQIFKSKGLNL